MTSKVLQSPVILGIIGSTIRIKHPDLTNYTKTKITTPFTAADTTLYVSDNRGFADNDWFVLSEPGFSGAEECDVNGAVTRGSSMTVTNSTKFSHTLHASVTKIYERGIKIYGASTDGGAGTLIASIDAITASTNQLADTLMIQWDKNETVFTLASTDTAYTYYYATFTDGTTESDASDYVLATGSTYQSVSQIVDSALAYTGAEVDGNDISYPKLLSWMNDWQTEVSKFILVDGSNERTKDWSFEEFEDKTSLVATQSCNSYALSGLAHDLKYSNCKKSIKQVKFGDKELIYKDVDYFEKLTENQHNTTLASTAAAAATSITLTDSSALNDSGTVYIGALTITYTDNDRDTNVLSGIPASGSGSITAEQASGTQVWQNVQPGYPRYYTVYGGNILLNVPVSSDYVNYKIRVKGMRKPDRLDNFASETIITPVDTAKFFLASMIENARGNKDESNNEIQKFYQRLRQEARHDPNNTMEQNQYYSFASIEDSFSREVKIENEKI